MFYDMTMSDVIFTRMDERCQYCLIKYCPINFGFNKFKLVEHMKQVRKRASEIVLRILYCVTKNKHLN